MVSCGAATIRGIGTVSGVADGTPSEYHSINFATADQRSDIVLKRSADHQSLHATPLTKSDKTNKT